MAASSCTSGHRAATRRNDNDEAKVPGEPHTSSTPSCRPKSFPHPPQPLDKRFGALATRGQLLRLLWQASHAGHRGENKMAVQQPTQAPVAVVTPRSEERRVGKECRSRGARYH